MSALKELFLNTIRNGLNRKKVVDCAVWAQQYRVMGGSFPGPWKWDNHPWLYEMHLCDVPKIVGQKSAQMGYTEWALNKAFFAMDVLGLSVLYVLPSSDDASDFSASRFDRALEASSHLAAFFSDVKNVGHKRAGNASLYVRGSRSRSKLKSIDTALIILDELDEMMQSNLALATERQSGQRVDTQQILMLSTPTIEDKGINIEYKASTQDHYNFKCPGCNRFIEFDFPDNIVITGESEFDPNLSKSYYKCNLCEKQLTPLVESTLDKAAINEYIAAKENLLRHKHFGGTGHSVPTYSDRETAGYYINQMYSCTILPSKLASSYLKGTKDPTEETEFFNSKMGKTHAVKGSKVTESDIIACQQQFGYGMSDAKNVPTKNGYRTMGIDVGGVNHIVIEEWTFPHERIPGSIWNDSGVPRILYVGKTSGRADDFGELDKLAYAFGVDSIVIDAEPERRESYKFATRLWGKVFLCDWLYSAQGRQVITGPEEECTVKANRTSWLDLSLGRFRNKNILIPSDVSAEFKSHVCEPQRLYKKDKNGNPFGYYESAKADHFAFARTYSELALHVGSGLGGNSNVSGVY